jgi:hypothetical protein
VRRGIRGMDSETWLEKAERLRSLLLRPGQAPGFDNDETAARERIKIALWLRREFADERETAGNVVPFAAAD